MTHRLDDHNSMRAQTAGSGAGFFIGLLAGAAMGAGLGILFAPKPGSELRGQLTGQANDLAATASRQYRRAASTASDLAERGREMYGQARQAVNRGADEAQRYVRDTADGVSDELAQAEITSQEGRS